MKKRKLKGEVKVVLVGLFLIGLAIVNVVKNFNVVTTDELGHTCHGTIIKVCGE